MLKVVRAHDPALAQYQGMTPADASPWLRYVRSREVADLPALGADKQYVFFHYLRLRRRVMINFVSAAPREEQKWERAFQAGVRRIEGPLVLADGSRVSDSWEPEAVRRPDYTLMTEDELDLFETLDVLDIGRVIYERSLLPLDCALLLGPLPTSAVAWDAYASRYAAQSQSGAAQSSEPPRAG